MSPIANITATSVNAKVYRKAPAGSFLKQGYLTGLFGYFSLCWAQLDSELQKSQRQFSYSFKMQKIVLSLFLITLTNLSKGQEIKLDNGIIHNWHLKTIKNSSNIEVDISLSEFGRKILFNKIKFKKQRFRASSWGQRRTGNWKIIGDTLQMTFSNSQISYYKIYKLDKNNLSLKSLDTNFDDLTFIYE